MTEKEMVQPPSSSQPPLSTPRDSFPATQTSGPSAPATSEERTAPSPPPAEAPISAPEPLPPSQAPPEPLAPLDQPPTMQDSLKKLAIGFGKATGKAAFALGKFTATKVLPKLLEMSKKQLEDVIERASEEEDRGLEDGVTGREFEDVVASIFQVRKYRVLQRNYHIHEREIDIIAARGDNAVMVECKARSTPVGTAEMDSYIYLFQQLRRQRIGGAALQKLIIVAPKGGVSGDAKNKAFREMGNAVEFWEKDRFLEEYEKVRYE